MLVRDPKPRNAFVPRSMPCTIFGPSSRVPGAYILFQDGRIREAVNVLASDLEPEELTFVRAHLLDWETPVSPSLPPPAEEWNPRSIDRTEIRRLPGQILGSDLMPQYVSREEPPAEAPQVEELAEPLLARIEELVDDNIENEDIQAADHEQLLASAAVAASSASKAELALRRSCRAIAHPHAFLTISEVSEHDTALVSTQGESAAATDGSANANTDVESTELNENSLHEFTDDDEYLAGITNHDDGESDLESLVGVDPGDPRAQ